MQRYFPGGKSLRCQRVSASLKQMLINRICNANLSSFFFTFFVSFNFKPGTRFLYKCLKINCFMFSGPHLSDYTITHK